MSNSIDRIQTDPSDVVNPPTALGVATLSVVLIVYSSTVHLVPGFNALYVPIGLTATIALAALSRRQGMSMGDLGLQRSTRWAGMSLGLIVALVVGTGLAIAIAVPAVHPLFDDARVGDIGPGLIVYRALIRIPLGTALLEEFAFRGVLFGAWRRVASVRNAALGSSVVFGLWHVRPAYDLLDANALAGTFVTQLAAVAGSVLVTAAAGVLFCWLRVRSQSLLAPFVAHAAINSMALLTAAIITDVI